jgi:hypothetical protein
MKIKNLNAVSSWLASHLPRTSWCGVILWGSTLNNFVPKEGVGYEFFVLGFKGYFYMVGDSVEYIAWN